MKQKYIELLGLPNSFTLDELDFAFKSRISELKKTEQNKDELLKYACLYNDAYHLLVVYCKNGINNDDNSNNHLFTDRICQTFGMSSFEAENTHKKMVNLGYEFEFNDYITKGSNFYKRIEVYKKDIIELMLNSDELIYLPYDRIVNMYFNDLLLTNETITCSSYVNTLISLCNSIKKIDKNFISLKKTYEEFMRSQNNFFLAYLVDKASIKFYCKELVGEEYIYKHSYEYENKDFEGTFTEYLEYLYEINRLTKELRLTNEELKKSFSMYKELGYGEKIIDFLREFYSVRKYCSSLPSIYFMLKDTYNSQKEEERTSSFLTWVELEQIKIDTNLSYAQILEKIYLTAKESGYEGSIEDCIKSMINTGEDNNNKKLILE